MGLPLHSLDTFHQLNDKLNLLIDKYKIVFFDFIVPEPVFISLALNLFIHKGIIDNRTAQEYDSCFGLNRTDGDKTTPYYDQTLDIFKNLEC